MEGRHLKLTGTGDKVYIDVLVGELLVRQHILLRKNLSPSTNEILSGYISVYIEKLGQFYIDQTGVTPQSIKVSEVLAVDTSEMSNTQLWVELKKL